MDKNKKKPIMSKLVEEKKPSQVPENVWLEFLRRNDLVDEAFDEKEDAQEGGGNRPSEFKAQVLRVNPYAPPPAIIDRAEKKK